ncbi:hypothetical protein JW921_03125 [Candidatus Fermentibacterales bacterium]|nr:hypothetical protein [Candidatus Fermentibacterales bacterium]
MIVCLAVLPLALMGCGQDEREQAVRGDSPLIRLESDDLCVVTMPRPDADLDSSVVQNGSTVAHVAFLLDTPVEFTLLQCPLPGGVPEARLEFLDSLGVYSAGFDAHGLLHYQDSRGASVIERIWPRGGSEAIVLRARAEGLSQSVLSSGFDRTLADAGLERSPAERGVYLSDTDSGSLLARVMDRDVSLPPELDHRLYLHLRPDSGSLSVTDTLTVVFTGAPEHGHLALCMPAEGTITDIEGFSTHSADSLLCHPDSLTGSYTGVFRAELDPFYVSSSYGDSVVVRGQVRPSSSFCAELWFYPGSALPEVGYSRVAVRVPVFLEACVPMRLDSTVFEEDEAVYFYSSGQGGMRGQLAWAVDSYTRISIAGGRSRLYYPSSSRPEDRELLLAVSGAELLAASIWDELGFEEAGLDFYLVDPLVGEATLRGSGCLLVSASRLAAIPAASAWLDSLVAGSRPEGTDVAARAAQAFLDRSTYLSPELRSVLSGYLVFRLAERSSERSDAGSLLREALLKYYLFETERIGGTEYAIADPQLLESPLREAVLLGKGPLVMSYLASTVGGFESGLSRGLSSLRHSGDPYLRFESAMRIGPGSFEEELFYSWLFGPGIPQVSVCWSDSAGGIRLESRQIQPGPDFPVVYEGCRVILRDGTTLDARLPPDYGGGSVFLPLGTSSGVVDVVVDPECLIPCDFTYERLASDED